MGIEPDEIQRRASRGLRPEKATPVYGLTLGDKEDVREYARHTAETVCQDLRESLRLVYKSEDEIRNIAGQESQKRWMKWGFRVPVLPLELGAEDKDHAEFWEFHWDLYRAHKLQKTKPFRYTVLLLGIGASLVTIIVPIIGALMFVSGHLRFQ